MLIYGATATATRFVGPIINTLRAMDNIELHFAHTFHFQHVSLRRETICIRSTVSYKNVTSHAIGYNSAKKYNRTRYSISYYYSGDVHRVQTVVDDIVG